MVKPAGNQGITCVRDRNGGSGTRTMHTSVGKVQRRQKTSQCTKEGTARHIIYRLVGVCTSLYETVSLPTLISIPCSTDLSSEAPIQFLLLTVLYSQLARSGCRQRNLVYQADQSMSNTIRVSVLVSSPPADARPKNGDKKSSRPFRSCWKAAPSSRFFPPALARAFATSSRRCCSTASRSSSRR